MSVLCLTYLILGWQDAWQASMESNAFRKIAAALPLSCPLFWNCSPSASPACTFTGLEEGCISLHVGTRCCFDIWIHAGFSKAIQLLALHLT